MYLSYMDRLMMDYFSPTFSDFNLKLDEASKVENSNFLSSAFKDHFEQLSVFIGS